MFLERVNQFFLQINLMVHNSNNIRIFKAVIWNGQNLGNYHDHIINVTAPATKQYLLWIFRGITYPREITLAYLYKLYTVKPCNM